MGVFGTLNSLFRSDDIDYEEDAMDITEIIEENVSKMEPEKREKMTKYLLNKMMASLIEENTEESRGEAAALWKLCNDTYPGVLTCEKPQF